MPDAGPLGGKLLMVSGTIPGYRRDRALIALKDAGARVSNEPKDVARADALIVAGQTLVKLSQGRDTKKTRVARDNNVPIIRVGTQGEFEQILSGRREIRRVVS